MAAMSTSTIPVIHKRLIGIWMSETLKLLVGRMKGICLAAVPNHSSIVA